MANPFSNALRSFWHTMTSNDRHSTFDSPQRSGRHVPLQTNRDGILTGVATASDSRADVSSSYFENGRQSPSADGRPGLSPLSPNPSNGGPYSPGLRSMAAKNASQGDGFEVQSPQGDVPMQSFHDGLPPAPPVEHSWRRIDDWAEDNYPELFDQLCEGATNNDLNELEHQLDCTLPQDVRKSLAHHDGQERGGTPTGIIFSSMLMDCEEIVQEWETWRKVNEQFLQDAAASRPSYPTQAHGGSSEASSSKRQSSRPSSRGSNPDAWRENLLAKQTCVPPNSVQKAYAHAGWIPLVRDWGGNNLAVDLAPGPQGKWGQIIMFGRDYDTKYVVARSWAHFLALVADDLNSGKWYVDEDTMELKLREFKEARVEPAYFNILRWRMDQKYGRKAPAQRKSMAPQPNGKAPSPLGSRSSSPYGAEGARGRSMQRLNGSSPLASPGRAGHGKPLPLSRVTEEMTIPEIGDAEIDPESLVDAEQNSPINGKQPAAAAAAAAPQASVAPVPEIKPLARADTDLLKDKDNDLPKLNGKQPALTETEDNDAMKTIEI